VVPRPGTDSAPIVPPCISTNLRQSASPRPVPCACRLAELSSCLNSRNSLGTSSGRVPTPHQRDSGGLCLQQVGSHGRDLPRQVGQVTAAEQRGGDMAQPLELPVPRRRRGRVPD
jgi:hypothetical protein